MKRQAGFTLLEVLVSLAILALVVVGVSAIFRSSMDTYQRVKAQTDTTGEAVLSLVAQDLANLWVPPMRITGEGELERKDAVFDAVHNSAGEVAQDRLTFVCHVRPSKTADGTPTPELARVTYAFEGGFGGELGKVVRRVAYNQGNGTFGDPVEQVLAEDLAGFGLEYSDGLNWQRFWAGGTGKVPRAVRVSVWVKEKDRTRKLTTAVPISVADKQEISGGTWR